MSHESLRRLLIFLIVLSFCTLLERLAPRRRPAAPQGPRRLRNFGLAALGVLAVKLLPFAPVGAALAAEPLRFGLLNLPAAGVPQRFLLSIVLLDLLVYVQHRLFHASNWLWRLHAVHHSDVEFDASTGIRFHPGELLLSAGFKSAGAALLGADPAAVALFEIILSSGALFSHSNIALPLWLDKPLRLALVTPDMHRVHHSTSADEMNTNFGFALPWWDRLLRTYRPQPRAPHETMPLGLNA